MLFEHKMEITLSAKTDYEDEIGYQKEKKQKLKLKMFLLIVITMKCLVDKIFRIELS